ncbi:hypothetical protein K7X08_023642 [Anisodus acutangulus]|uniref:Uncharacterized protein n=1 Tax=Anisodus acutangulus TaxID=402998 RepID=A0A9Q1L8I3_9SOLA|nr:hypothetical protein K7X08_023642 [Anisodus acutangulus]
MPQLRRKKWTEAEERTLIDKYGEMLCDGTLAKMKTREKKYRPIALHVNSVHHVHDPITYPWQWTWKDVSTKVQNMRHQYTLVKQKIKKPNSGDESEEFDWMEGLTHWSNFLRYKEVFGDVNTLVFNCTVVGDGNENGGGFDQFGHLGHVGDGDFTGGVNGVDDHGVTGMEFDYDGEEGEENFNGSSIRRKEYAEDGFVYEDIEPTGSDTRKKKKILKGAESKRGWGFLAMQLAQLKEIEARFEQRETERERERQRREHIRIELEQERERKWEEREKTREKLERQRVQEWEVMEKESEERGRRRREEQLIFEREREERMHKRRSEWKKRIDETLGQHRAEMSQIQTRILHEQQNLTSQLLGIFSQWTGHPTGLSDHTGASNHYLSQMMQNLHHVNGMVHGDTRVEEDAQEDQFIVDG